MAFLVRQLLSGGYLRGLFLFFSFKNAQRVNQLITVTCAYLSVLPSLVAMIEQTAPQASATTAMRLNSYSALNHNNLVPRQELAVVLSLVFPCLKKLQIVLDTLSGTKIYYELY